MPCSTASRSALRPSLSSTPRHISPPMPQAPKPTSETRYPVLPSARCFIVPFLFESDSGSGGGKSLPFRGQRDCPRAPARAHDDKPLAVEQPHLFRLE